MKAANNYTAIADDANLLEADDKADVAVWVARVVCEWLWDVDDFSQ